MLDASASGRITWDFEPARASMGIGEHQMRDLMHRADDPLPHVRWGRRVVFSPELVQPWFRRQHERPPDAPRPRGPTIVIPAPLGERLMDKVKG